MNTRATGLGSFAVGNGALSTSFFSFAMGWNAQSDGIGALSIGHTTQSTGLGSLAMGYYSVSSDQYSIAIGDHATASGNYSIAIGSNVTSSGNMSVALGSYASTNSLRGCFVFGDVSSPANVVNTVANQFMVRAAGGTVIYSSSDLGFGVTLAPGSGSWGSVSDRNRKENFEVLDGELLLGKISAIPVQTWN